MEPTFLNRNVNEGFSGGEKKRNEILQLAVLEVRCELWKCEGVEVWGAALTRRSVTRSCSLRCSRCGVGVWVAKEDLGCGDVGLYM